jgi:hypothetical protein
MQHHSHHTIQEQKRNIFFSLSQQPSKALFNGLLLIAALYVLALQYPGLWFKPLFYFTIFCFVLLKGKDMHNAWLWGIISLFFTSHLISKYYYVANHHFVITYMAWAITLYFLFPHNNEKRLRFHFVAMLAIILFFSALHKALSASFTNGIYFLYEMNLGHFFKPMKVLSNDWGNAVENNKNIYSAFMRKTPVPEQFTSMQEVVAGAEKIAKIGSILAILMEFAAAAAIWLKPSDKSTHALLLLTIISIFLLRLETGFLALLSLMCLYLSPTNVFRVIYLLLMIIFATFMVTGLGFH